MAGFKALIHDGVQTDCQRMAYLILIVPHTSYRFDSDSTQSPVVRSSPLRFGRTHISALHLCTFLFCHSDAIEHSFYVGSAPSPNLTRAVGRSLIKLGPVTNASFTHLPLNAAAESKTTLSFFFVEVLL